MASFQAKTGWEMPKKRENKKKIILMCSYPTRNRKFQKKKSKKILKIKKTSMASFKAKISWERPRKRKNKKNRSDELLPDP